MVKYPPSGFVNLIYQPAQILRDRDTFAPQEVHLTFSVLTLRFSPPQHMAQLRVNQPFTADSR